MSLYERVAAKAGGGRVLAVARLRRSVLVVLHKALKASGLNSQSELAQRLPVRRSAVNQVFRGDGNVRISTLAEYLYEMGFEAHITLVKAGELRAAVLENRSPMPAFASWSASASLSYAACDVQTTGTLGCGPLLIWRTSAVNANFAPSMIRLISPLSEPGGDSSALPVFESINLSADLVKPGIAP
jgi:hypothetical protein